MLGEQEGITRTLLRKLGVSPDDVAQKLSITIDKFPKISREILLKAPRSRPMLKEIELSLTKNLHKQS